MTVAAVVVLGAIATFSLGVEPAIATQLGLQLRLPPHMTGLVLSAEVGACMLASLPGLLWSRRVAPRALALIAALAFVAANLLSSLYPTYVPLLAWRALAGLACGTLLIVVLAGAARCANPERVYAAWVIGQILPATAGLYGLQRLFATAGLQAVYLLMALAMILSLPLIRGLPRRPAPNARDLATPRGHRLSQAAAALCVLFLFYASVGGIWAFAADRGAAAGIAAPRVATELAAASLAGIAGAALAAWIGQSRWRTRLLIAGHGTLACALVLFAVGDSDWMFAASAILLQIAWSFTAPFLLALAAATGAPGSMMSSANFVLGAGLTAGPLLTGNLLELPGAFVLAAAASGLLLGAGTILLAWCTSVGADAPRDGGDQGVPAS
jgi:predicted MFS family arabinose efflux permease